MFSTIPATYRRGARWFPVLAVVVASCGGSGGAAAPATTPAPASSSAPADDHTPSRDSLVAVRLCLEAVDDYLRRVAIDVADAADGEATTAACDEAEVQIKTDRAAGLKLSAWVPPLRYVSQDLAALNMWLAFLRLDPTVDVDIPGAVAALTKSAAALEAML